MVRGTGPGELVPDPGNEKLIGRQKYISRLGKIRLDWSSQFVVRL
jgi:hypothetical protein